MYFSFSTIWTDLQAINDIEIPVLWNLHLVSSAYPAIDEHFLSSEWGLSMVVLVLDEDSTNASSFLKYPRAIWGPFTCNSPSSSWPASDPSGFTTRATVPGTIWPALPRVPMCWVIGTIVIVVHVSVMPYTKYWATYFTDKWLPGPTIALSNRSVR